MKTFKAGEQVGVERLYSNAVLGWATYLGKDKRPGYHRIEVDVGGYKMIMAMESDRLLSATEAWQKIRGT